MARTNINVNLHLDKKNNILPIRNIAQGTNNFDIIVSVFSSSAAYTIPATTTARIYIKKPDNTLIYNDCTIASNKITCALTTQSTIAAGTADVEIELTDSADNTITRTTICKLDIVKSNIDASAIQSTNEFTTLQTALQTVGSIDSKLDKVGDSKDCTATFTEAATEEDINSTETHATIFGKIKKSISTFRSDILTLFNDKLDKTSVIANLTTTVPGSALDATMGKDLADDITDINTSLSAIADVQTDTITPASGITISYSDVRKKNGIVYATVYCNKTDSSEFSADRTSLFTLSSGFRPSIAREFSSTSQISIGGYFNTAVNLLVNTDGVVSADKITGLTNARQIRMCFSYII